MSPGGIAAAASAPGAGSEVGSCRIGFSSCSMFASSAAAGSAFASAAATDALDSVPPPPKFSPSDHAMPRAKNGRVISKL